MADKYVTERVCYLEEYGRNGWPFEYGTKLVSAIGWLQERLAEIPEPYRPDATFEVSSDAAYDSSHATLEISYLRPETSDERAAREAREASELASRRARAIAEAKATLAKYGIDGGAKSNG